MTSSKQPAIVGKEALLNLANWIKKHRNGSVSIESCKVGQCAQALPTSPDQLARQDGITKGTISKAEEGR